MKAAELRHKLELYEEEDVLFVDKEGNTIAIERLIPASLKLQPRTEHGHFDKLLQNKTVLLLVQPE